jgi:copper chaperone
MTEVIYSIPNISCDHCVHTINIEVGEIAGVQSVQADANSKQVKILFDSPATENQIKNLLAEINYPVVD